MLLKNNQNLKCWPTVLFIVMSALAGCAASAGKGTSIDWIAPGEHQIVCTAPEFKNTTPVRIEFRDTWQVEEYAMYKTADSQLEVIFTKVNKANTVSLLYQMSIADMVSTWNHNPKKNIEWKDRGRIDAHPGTWFYRTYSHIDTKRSCVGFFVEWEEIFEDSQTRPGKLLFGYYCSDGENPIDDQKVRTLIGGIRIQVQDGKFASGEAVTDETGNPSALAAAKGDAPNAETGNSGFPFKFARYYRESGGRRF